ncbi:MAG: hypothetical protein HRU06_00810 [Oceanospirillaceae bacterium]|nr:hypothetical protein [Oceanospirillaceae bacterium]
MFALLKSSPEINFKTTCYVLLFTLLTGCGFTLRGNIELPISAQSLWLVTDSHKNSLFQQQFKLLAQQNNLTLDEDAELKIVITRINFRKITTTLDADADVDEYTLRGELSFDIIGSDEEQLAGNLEAFSERTFQYDANDAAASNSREAFLNAELWRDLSQQILRQYAARVRIK